MINTWGLLKIEDRKLPVDVVGIEPDGMESVMDFRDTLHWTSERICQDLTDDARREFGKKSQESDWGPDFNHRLDMLRNVDFRKYAMDFKMPSSHAGNVPPGIIPGVAVAGSVRDENGNYHFDNSSVFQDVTLTVVPTSREGGLEQPAVKAFQVLNEFKSGLYEIDPVSGSTCL